MVRLVVLNTFEWPPDSVGSSLRQRSRGRMREGQRAWLREELERAEAEGSVVLAFGHHPLDSFVGDEGERLASLLVGSRRVAAYFAGHTHEHDLRAHEGPGRDHPLWEVVGGTNVEHPQFGVHVELLEDAGVERAGFLRLRTVESRLDEAPAECGEVTTVRSPLPCQVRRGREGARRDAGAGWREERARAIEVANLMLPVALRGD